LSCSHCFNDSGVSGEDELDFDHVCDVVDMACDAGFTEIQITGGEALTREDIIQIIEYIYAKNMPVLLQTNGVMDNRVLKQLLSLDAKRTVFIVSLDGFETNSKLRGSSATESTIGFIDAVSPRFNTRINTLLSSEISDREIHAMVDFAIKVGAILAFNPIVPTGRGDVSRLMRSGEYFRHMACLQKMNGEIRKGFMYDEETGLFYDNEDCPVRRGKGIFVNSAGDCYPCGFLEGIIETRIGNVIEDGGFIGLEMGYPVGCKEITHECASCEHYLAKRCFAGCPARIYAMCGNFKGREYYCMAPYSGRRFNV
jgi:MoaA/NifB/PqqE/SkfB family radical SAM enzyme